MSENESDEGLSMLVCKDTLSDQYENEIPDNTPTSMSVVTSGPYPSKELRMQQQDDDSSQEDADDGAVIASVVLDNDNVDAEPPPKKRKTGSSSSKNKSKKKISQDRLEAASEARRMLVDTVPRLPVSVAESHVVRSFGRIYVETSSTDEKESRYSSANALYPIGFSCDRYEFSPVHGRVLKMRCTIFDGKDLKKKQRKHGFTSDYPDGPVFRVMWGQGVDDDAEIIDYPFDAYSSSAPISTDTNLEVAVPFDGKSKRADTEPEEGMRVRVRHDNDVWYTGTIVAVGDYIEVIRNVTTYEITINYDDGAVEDTYFPDPDISIYPPSSEDLTTENGIIEVDELRGKAVTCVVGSSPLEACGKALVKLGLIDEIMLQRACESLNTARVEGREEAKEKMEEKKLQRQQARARMHQRQAETTEDGNDAATKEKESPEAVDASKAEDLPMSERTLTTEDASKAEVPMTKEAPTAELVRDSDDADKAMKADGDDTKRDNTTDNEVVCAVPSSGVDNDTEEASTTADTAPSFVVNNGEEVMAEPSKDKKAIKKAETDSNADELKQDEEEDEPEPASEAEKELRSQLIFVQDELAALQAEVQEVSVALADARISTMGPFLINPFRETDSQQSSWLLTAVRKEKLKMGSTGNKKKIVTATDLLERNDSFFNGDIEALVEGLPGSEYCPSYVFKVFRAGGAAAVSQAWVHEAKLRQEREHEKHMKSASHAKAKASELRERELKRKRRDDERDARKKIKEKEEDEKKKARAEERMSRLGVQVDERLFKEACFQREKVILLIARSLGKEFANRRKSAELVSGQAVMDEHARSGPLNSLAQNLPPLARLYDEDVLRIWDFFIVFGKSFLQWGYLPSLPSLDSLQDAINTLRGENATKKSRSESVDQLVNLAITLCHPLGASLTKLMFASLIALNPALQKDFGAAFFAEVNAATNAKDESSSETPTALLPVNKMTWQEIARLSFLSDALGEIGYNRQETAHLLRGYRSVGHPNSKEAKRLRRSEDFLLALLRQDLSQRLGLESSTTEKDTGGFKFRLHVPCRPSSSVTMWIFYLHNVKSLPIESLESTKKNIQKAIALLEKTEPKPTGAESIFSDLGRSLGLLEEISLSDELSSTDLQICKKARRIVFRVLDRESGEVYSRDTFGQIVYKDGILKTDVTDPDNDGKSSAKPKFERQRIGLLNALALSDHEYKQLVHQREAYMAEALRLKEELKEGEVEEDDDDDDDDDDGNCNGKEKETKTEDTSDAAKQAIDDNGGQQSISESAPKNNGQRKAEALSVNDAKNGSLASSEIVATIIENGVGNSHETKPDSHKIGKATQYDEFCGDIPDAPDLLRRCLAVLRTLCQSGPAESFLFPVDPQTNPGYYEIILKPMCLREVGMALRDDISKYLRESPSRGESENEKEIATIVAQFGRKIRLISQNCSCYVNAGPLIVAAGEEMTRIFERLFFDWVLSPKTRLPPLEFLDDDHCVEFHSSDEDALILICDGCEGKYNMSRLDPPLLNVPKGDWFCPRCLRGHCWEDVDHRIGKTVCSSSVANCDTGPSDSSARSGIVRRCLLGQPEGENSRATLVYDIEFEDGWRETWPLSWVDKALSESGQTVEPVVCVEAVAESPGYGLGIDRGVLIDLVPVPLNPGVSDTAAQAAVSSSVFRDTLAGSSALRLISPEEMTANEWLRLLVLLITKCSSSEIMQSLASKMESEAAEKMAKQLQENSGKVIQVYEVLPSVSDDDQNSKSDVVEVDAEIAVPAESSDKSTVLVNGEETVMTVKAKAFEEVDSTAMVVEAGAIEVVTEIESEPMAIATATASPENSYQDEIPSQDALEKARRDTAIADKEKRQKAREDSIAAFCIKNELHPTVASFEEDVVSQVVDSTLLTEKHGLDFASCRSRGMVCKFCGLSDLALGTPLVRAPSCAEWNELIPHAARSRRTSVLAELPNTKKLTIVKIRVGGEIISMKEEEDFFEGSPDGAMMEFLPKNESGFQYELRCRDEASLPYVTGSLAAHECCAIVAHKTRKERIVREHAEKEAYLVEWDASMTCGRTLSLGKDAMGRSYWKFNEDSSLFVCADAALRTVNSASPTWHRFTEPEEIASVMYCLGIDSVVSELKRAFPKAARMLKSGTWSELLLKRRFPMNWKESLAAVSPKISSTEPTKQEIAGEESDVDEQDPYSEHEDVLVESSCGKLLWDATVVGVSHAKNSGKVNGYRVHYKEWSSRFDEWVDPFRVVEPVENNIEVQAEMLEELVASRGIPAPLENMTAKDFLHANDRARGSATLPDFLEISKVAPSASSDERTFGLLKAALILVEAALPLGAVDISDQGPWSTALASEWRSVVRSAIGPSSLMRCVILLEECLSLEWMQPHFSHLLACMPIKWKAINEASVSSLATRIFLIDKGVHYDKVDK